MYHDPGFDLESYRNWLMARAHAFAPDVRSRFVTFSREYGCEGFATAATLASLLEQERPDQGAWIVLSHPALEKLISDETLGVDLIDEVSERRYSFINWFIDGIVPDYLKSPQSRAFERLRTLILNLAEKGNCIIVGGGAQIITSRLDTDKFAAAHFRLVAPYDHRVKTVMRMEKVSEDEAVHILGEKENARNRFVEDFTSVSPAAPHLYHLTLNNEMANPNLMARTALYYLENCGFFE